MSSMLSLISRNLQRSSIRSICNILDNSIAEVPLKQIFVCQSSTVIRRYSIKVNKEILRAHKRHLGRNDRFFQTSRIYYAGQIVKVPPFAESVTEGDVKVCWQIFNDEPFI